MTEELKNKPLAMLSVRELVDVILPALGIRPRGEVANEEKGKKYVYGVAGLAELLNCSIATAQRRLSSGILEECIIRSGRKIIIDQEATLEILKRKGV